MSGMGCGRTALSPTTLHSEVRRPDDCSSSAGLEPLQTDLALVGFQGHGCAKGVNAIVVTPCSHVKRGDGPVWTVWVVYTLSSAARGHSPQPGGVLPHPHKRQDKL